MHPSISWCQRPHLAGTLHIRRRFLEGDRTIRDAVTDIPLDLRQVPRHLAEGAAAEIRTIVILVGWKRFEKLGRKLGFHVPDLAEAVQLVDGCHDVLRMRVWKTEIAEGHILPSCRQTGQREGARI